MSRSVTGCSLVCGVLGALLAAPASAHIRLLEPAPRHLVEGFDTNIKSCPCGAGASNRFCDVERDGSDPNRSVERVSRFAPGETIVLRFEEYVDHAGRFRVAFDPDGADHADFNANVLVDIPDPAGVTGNTAEAGVWELAVTLPEMSCDNCTLQLIQAMHGDTESLVTDPARLSSYYTCIDLTLGDAREPAAPGSLDASAAPMGGEEPQTGGEAGTSSAIASGLGASAADPVTVPKGDLAACGLAPHPRQPALAGCLGLATLLLGLMARWKRGHMADSSAG